MWPMPNAAADASGDVRSLAKISQRRGSICGKLDSKVSPPPSPLPRFKLIIEYAGTRYSGWQIQKNARTVQGELDEAVRTVTGRKDFELYGSGRTDAGVHALAQVAHLDVSTSLPPESLRRLLNDELPVDV